jgi:hypothetical protein
MKRDTNYVGRFHRSNWPLSGLHVQSAPVPSPVTMLGAAGISLLFSFFSENTKIQTSGRGNADRTLQHMLQ